MRIAVLGQYNPGACGVSDYANLLSEELEEKFSCSRISIDSSNASSFSSLADSLPEADLISLQFAPYAFSTNGLSGAGLLKFAKAVRHRNPKSCFMRFGSEHIQELHGWKDGKAEDKT